MSKGRPHIGVTGPDAGGTAAWWFTKWAVFLQGGKAVRIQPGNDEPKEELHGLIIGGGADINPRYYGGEESPKNTPPKKKGFRNVIYTLLNILFFPLIYVIRTLFATPTPAGAKRRDEMEFALLQQAIDKGWPVLGICRGSQLINVHFGGTLHNDIANFYTEVPYMHTIWPKKKVSLAEGTTLSKILSFEQIWVNAMHHQAVDKRGDNICVAAKESNGIIQAIEHQGMPFMIGVQWHPEYLPQIPGQRRIFRALVDQAHTCR